MNGTISYRRGQSDISDITAHLMACDAGFIPPLSQRLGIAAYAAKLVVHATCFEAWAEQTLAGLVAIYCNQPASPAAFISSVSVLPLWRGQGIAGRLIEQAAGHAADLGFISIELHVAAANTAALRFYARHHIIARKRHGDELTLGRSLTVSREHNGTA